MLWMRKRPSLRLVFRRSIILMIINETHVHRFWLLNCDGRYLAYSRMLPIRLSDIEVRSVLIDFMHLPLISKTKFACCRVAK